MFSISLKLIDSPQYAPVENFSSFKNKLLKRVKSKKYSLQTKLAKEELKNALKKNWACWNKLDVAAQLQNLKKKTI